MDEWIIDGLEWEKLKEQALDIQANIQKQLDDNGYDWIARKWRPFNDWIWKDARDKMYGQLLPIIIDDDVFDLKTEEEKLERAIRETPHSGIY
jgi:hypothetical protein